LDILTKEVSGEKISRKPSLCKLLFYPAISPSYFQALFTVACTLPPSNRKLNVNFESKPCIYFVSNKYISVKTHFPKFYYYNLIWNINWVEKLSLPLQKFVIFLIHCTKIKSDFKCYTFNQILWKLSNISQFATQTHGALVV
jgi:hypothetical protein